MCTEDAYQCIMSISSSFRPPGHHQIRSYVTFDTSSAYAADTTDLFPDFGRWVGHGMSPARYIDQQVSRIRSFDYWPQNMSRMITPWKNSAHGYISVYNNQ